MNMVRGILVVLEGCDKSGKSTQCRKLVQFLINNGYSAELLRFPERSTVVGQVIDKYMKGENELDDRAVHLLFSANRWEFAVAMRQKLDSGVTLVIDRYVFSGVVYSTAKGLDEDWWKACDRGLLRPDKVFYLNVDVSDLQRGDFGMERYEQLAFQEKEQKLFLSLVDDKWQIVDARRSIDKIHAELCVCS